MIQSADLDHVQIVLDDDDGVALVAPGAAARPAACGRPAKCRPVVGSSRIYTRFAGRPSSGSSRRQLHALRFAAGQRRRWLPEPDIAQTRPRTRVSQVARRCTGTASKNCAASSMGMSSTSATDLALVLHLERLAVVALAMAFLAGHVHVRQEVHFDLQGAVALAGFAAAALDVEARTGPGRSRVPALPGVSANSVRILVPYARVGGRVGTRSATDRTLVHVDRPCRSWSMPVNRAVCLTGHDARAVEACRPGRRVQDAVDERGFTGAGHACDGR